MLKDVYNWRQTKKGSLIFGGLGLVLAYIFFSLAINSGSILQYLISFALIIVAVQDFFRAGNKQPVKHGKSRSKKSA